MQALDAAALVPEPHELAERWLDEAERRRLEDFEGALCKDCGRFGRPCACGCGWALCELLDEHVNGNERACDPEYFRWK